jgi:predicted nucleotidyltransferase component of viral defense system
MILPNSNDAIHKTWLYRVLTEICDNQKLSNSLYFKGGTCAAMRGLLDRFSIDLDFDYVADKKNLAAVRKELEKAFNDLGLEIKDNSQNVPQYFLRYPINNNRLRNTLKIDITMPPPKNNKYEAVRLIDIDRIIYCQTIETMFANKLVALIERHEKNQTIAGRDLYDIHYFFINGFRYNEQIIIERRKNKKLDYFFNQLKDFIKEEITEKIITQDLNVLLPYDKFIKIRKNLKQEALIFIQDEIKRLENTIK